MTASNHTAPRLTKVGVVTLAISAIATAAGWWYGWTWIMLGLSSVGLLAWHRHQLIVDVAHLQIKWQLPSQVIAQNASLYGLIIQTNRSQGIQLQWSDEQGWRDLHHFDSALMWQRRRFVKRGHYCLHEHLPPLFIRDLLEFWHLQLPLPACTVTVLPVVGTVHQSNPLTLPRDDERGLVPGQQGNGEPDRVRPFQPGDNLKHMHWRLSARLEQWLVRHEQADQDHVLFLHLDLFGEDGLLLEKALATAVTLIAHADHGHRPAHISLSGPGMENIVVDFHQASHLLAHIDVHAPAPEIPLGAVVIGTRNNDTTQQVQLWLGPEDWDRVCQLPRLRQRHMAAGGIR